MKRRLQVVGEYRRREVEKVGVRYRTARVQVEGVTEVTDTEYVIVGNHKSISVVNVMLGSQRTTKSEIPVIRGEIK